MEYAGLLGTLLLSCLLNPLYLSPHEVARFPHHVYRLTLVRAVEFDVVLHPPDMGQGTRQPLCAVLLQLLVTLRRHRALLCPIIGIAY